MNTEIKIKFLQTQIEKDFKSILLNNYGVDMSLIKEKHLLESYHFSQTIALINIVSSMHDDNFTMMDMGTVISMNVDDFYTNYLSNNIKNNRHAVEDNETDVITQLILIDKFKKAIERDNQCDIDDNISVTLKEVDEFKDFYVPIGEIKDNRFISGGNIYAIKAYKTRKRE